ncbi:MAG: CoA-transferase [Candidatus Hodarchaeales archaeon]|jgi:acyl CoA:acetate/3-ketoacid CoA transferase alpha subunit/acyl CoA:acetate/3-ketoacid CoA transferase beta subunit
MTGLKQEKKISSLEKAVEWITNGDTLALGGFMMHNHPMALVREIIRQEKRNLSLIISPSAGIAADLLIGAGCVAEIRSTYVGFDHLGLAPSFRYSIQEGLLKVIEYDEATVVAGLKAGAGKLPFSAITSVIGSDILKVNTELKVVKNPLDNSKVIVLVPALKPDVMIGQVQLADPNGNAVYWGSRFTDVAMARAAKKVIIIADEMIPNEKLIRSPARTVLSSAFVDLVINLPGGAYPCSSHGRYIHDEKHLLKYLELAKSKKIDKYLDEHVYSFNEQEARVITQHLSVSSKKAPIISQRTNQVITNDSYTTSEFIAIILSRELRDGDTGGVGANSAIPIGAARLAQQIHAPSLSFVLSGGGVYNTKSKTIYNSSTDCRYFLDGAEAIMELGNDFFDFVEQGPDFFFFGGIQIDQHGNFNLHCVGDWEKPLFRGPGLPSVAAAVNAKKFFLYSVNQTKRQFVEKCDFISGPGFLDGYNKREELGLEGGGPALCVTNLAVYDFDEESKKMRLKSLNPGVSLETIKQNTGFELILPEKLIITLPPTRMELETIRTHVDTTGTLARSD